MNRFIDDESHQTAFEECKLETTLARPPLRPSHWWAALAKMLIAPEIASIIALTCTFSRKQRTRKHGNSRIRPLNPPPINKYPTVSLLPSEEVLYIF